MIMRRFLPSMSALTAFAAAAKHMNFTRAAEDLGLTQSGVSRQIGILEDFLGTRLFDREGPRLILTDAGRTYAADVGKVLEDIEQASIDVVRGWKSRTALLVGALPSVAALWLAPRMGGYARRHPNAQYEITTTQGEVDFASTALDIAVLRGRGNWKGAQATLLIDEKVVVVASPDLIPPGVRLAPDRFRDYALLQNSSRPDIWMRWLRATGQVLSGNLQGPRLGNTSMLINAVASGIGIAVVPDFMIGRELKTGLLHTPFAPPVSSGDAYFAVYPERKAHMKPVLDFRDWLVDETRSLRRRAP